jgi:hypothetical protein
MENLVNIFVMEGKAYIRYQGWAGYECMADNRGNGSNGTFTYNGAERIRVFYVKDEKEIREILTKEEL